jgi:hypothetical protein
MADFDKPLNEWIDEPQRVKRPALEFDPQSKTARMVEKTETVYVRTMYTKAEPRPFSCANGHHQWKIIDRHSYTAKCQLCPLYKRLIPAFEYLDKDGHIRSRETGEILS